MGRWRCPARVTALLLCKGWQEGDAEREEEQLLLAGDVQVNFVAVDVLTTFLYFLSRVVSGNMEEMVPPLSPPLHFLEQGGSYGAVSPPARPAP